MNCLKKRYCLSLLVRVILLCLAVSSFGSPPVLADWDPVIMGYRNMAFGTNQQIQVWNHRTDTQYTWTASGGGGSLGGTTGTTVHFTAPWDCPPTTVTVTDGEGGTGEIRIGFYNPDYASTPHVICETICPIDPNRCNPKQSEACCHGLMGINCDGSVFYGPLAYLVCCKRSYIPDDCDNSCDLAAEQMEFYPYYYTYECCPALPEPEVPPPDDWDECDPGNVGDPITLYNGNNFEKQEDLRFPSAYQRQLTFSRFYNSRAKTGLVDVQSGWRYGYDIRLEPVCANPEGFPIVYMTIVDETGRQFYFLDLDEDSRWDGAFKEPSHLMFEDGGWTWYRLDGSKYRFTDQVGVLELIEDPLGNRQTLAYDGQHRLQTVTDEASGRILTFHYDGDNRLSHISGPVTEVVPDGIWVQYAYDADSNLISVTYADGSGFSYDYDSNDNLTEKRDKLGHLLSSWTYDTDDRAYQSFTRDGRGVSINYVGDRSIVVTDVYGVTRTYAIEGYDGHKRVVSITEPGGCSNCGTRPIRYSYDGMLNVIEEEYANGAIHQYDNFDGRGNPQTVTLDVGTLEQRTILYTYHPDTDQKLTQIEVSTLGQENKETIWDYDNDYDADANENPTRLLSRQIERGYTRDNTGAIVSYEYITTYHYNSKGQVLCVDGPLSGSQDMITYSYDPTTGDLLSVTLPVVGTSTYANYDAAGNVGTVTDINGVQTTYTYDGRNRVLSTNRNGVVTSQTYTLAGDLQSTTDAESRTSTFTYDTTYGRLTRISDPAGNSLRYAYDAQGNRIEDSAYDAGDTRRRYLRYDYQHPESPGRLWKEIYPDDSEIVYAYDGMGNRTSITDALSRTTTYAYDHFSRLTQVEQPGAVVTKYAYDAHGNLAQVTDAEDHSTSYTYDDMGRLLRTVSPDTGTTDYTYDAAGNLVSKTFANGITVTYTYDALGRLTGVHFPDSAQDITYTYDQGANGKGLLTAMTDPSGSYTYTYDALGNLITKVKIIDGVTYTAGYAYDRAGILTGMTYPDDRTVTYELLTRQENR